MRILSLFDDVHSRDSPLSGITANAASLELNRISFSSRASFHRTRTPLTFFPSRVTDSFCRSVFPRSTFRERSNRDSSSRRGQSFSSFVRSILIKFVERVKRFDSITYRRTRIVFVNSKKCLNAIRVRWKLIARRDGSHGWFERDRDGRQNRGSHATLVRVNWFIVIYDRRPDAINRLGWLLYQLALVAFRPRTANHSAPSTIDPPFSHRICSTKFIPSL